MQCTDITCKYNKDCKCISKRVKLTHCSIITMYQGRQRFLKCSTYKESEEYVKLKEKLKDIKFDELLDLKE